MSIIIYKDNEANGVFIEDANGVQFLNNLHAFSTDPSSDNVSVQDSAKKINLISEIDYTQYLDDSGNQYGANATETINNLNAIFQTSGTGLNSAPAITSSTSIDITLGDTINYELTADYGVGFEWENLPVGVTTVEGNVRKIIGGSGLGVGSYTPTMRAINYNGIDEKTLTINVTNPPYTNTRAIKFTNLDYMDAPAATSSPFYRPTNGAGASDAWTIVAWFKGGTSFSNNQTIVSFGSNSPTGAHIWAYWDNTAGDRRIVLEYGTVFNNLILKTPISSFTQNTYRHIMITYDGGTTGNTSGDIADYYSRFNIYIDGVNQVLTTSNTNYGYTGEIPADIFRIGEFSSGGRHLKRNSLIDEVGLWPSDQSANIAPIYNGGITHDLALLATPPDHFWRMGDGDTFPIIQDNIGLLNFTMFNMTSSDIVNDVPQ